MKPTMSRRARAAYASGWRSRLAGRQRRELAELVERIMTALAVPAFWALSGTGAIRRFVPARTGRELEDHGDVTNPRGGFVMGENKARAVRPSALPEDDGRRLARDSGHRRWDNTRGGRGTNGGGRGLAPIPPHGAELRGMDLVTQSPTTEGRLDSCSRTSHRTRPRIRCSATWVS